MSAILQNWLHLAGDEVPALPDPFWLRCYMVLGWAVLMAWLVDVATGAVCARLGLGLSIAIRRALAGGLALWTLVPGPLSPGHWLGLAFQSPSYCSVVLGLLALRSSMLAGHARLAFSAVGAKVTMAWCAAGVLLGYLLLLDTLALLPWPLYPAGFSSSVLLLLLGLALLPWVFAGRRAGAAAIWLPLTLLAFALTRLPNGNVWDALIDPWLWVVLQVQMLRRALNRPDGA